MQTDYNDPPIAYAGMLADSGNNDILTYNNPSMAVPFGRALLKIVGDDDGVKLPDADAVARFLAVSVYDAVQNEDGAYPEKSAISGIRKGRIYVEVEEAVTVDDAVYTRYLGKKQVQTITFSGVLITGNKVNLKINDVSMVEVPFNTSHAQTMADLDAAISAMVGVNNVTVGGNVLTITSDQDGALLITNVVVTEGVSQATATVAETVPGIPLSDRGRFRKTADSATAFQITAGAKWTRGAAAGGFAVLDLNLP